AGGRELLLGVTAGIEAVILAETVTMAALSGRPVPAGLRYALIVALSLAMGVQNATARKLAVPDLTTTVLTLTITRIAADSPIAGATLVLRVHIVYPLVIALVILAVVAVAAVARARNPRTSPSPAM